MKELQLRILAGAVVTESELPKAAKYLQKIIDKYN